MLPAGLADGLPPHAGHEAMVVARLMASFAGCGYERVDPPLVEFEESLLAGDEDGLAAITFRVMDPVSQRMMGLRADITVQIARIAHARLGDQARPLRLCYAGAVLQTRSNQLRPERQFTQVGYELIGEAGIAADVEVMRLAAGALASLGVNDLTIDLNAAPLVPLLFAAHDIRGERALQLRAALDRKDAHSVASLAGTAAPVLGGLLAATGPGRAALMILTSIDLPAEASGLRQDLARITHMLLEHAPHLTITLDPVENRGFEYYNGVGFTLFAPLVRGELGRGGRYLANGEPAVGCSLYMNAVTPVVPPVAAQHRLYVPFATPPVTAEQLRTEGWITVAGLAPVVDEHGEALRLNCVYRWHEGRIENCTPPHYPSPLPLPSPLPPDGAMPHE